MADTTNPSGQGLQDAAGAPSGPAGDRGETHHLRVTYEVDGVVVKVIERQIDESYRWFLIGNSSWREW